MRDVVKLSSLSSNYETEFQYRKLLLLLDDERANISW